PFPLEQGSDCRAAVEPRPVPERRVRALIARSLHAPGDAGGHRGPARRVRLPLDRGRAREVSLPGDRGLLRPRLARARGPRRGCLRDRVVQGCRWGESETWRPCSLIAAPSVLAGRRTSTEVI